MPRFNNLTGSGVTGTGTVNLSSDSRTLGGIGIITDGTNLVTVTIKKTDSSGDVIFYMETTQSMYCVSPFDAADTVYYDVSGTGGKLCLQEWSPYQGARD